jgi:hypothetical protein
MQVGAESKNKTIAAIALMVVAVALLGRWIFFSEGTAAAPAVSTAAPAESDPAVETPRPTASGHKVLGKRKNGGAAQSLDPTLRYDLLRASEDTEYKGAGRNIFQAQVDIPKPIRSVRTDKTPPPPPPPPSGPPPPPPIDLKFFGFASRPGEAKRVFLSHGEDVFVAGEGDIVDRRYKLLRISAASVEVEDVLNNNRQEIFLTPNSGV